jgi:hypothetical protein
MVEERDQRMNPQEGLAEELEDRQDQEGVRVELRQQQPILLQDRREFGRTVTAA